MPCKCDVDYKSLIKHDSNQVWFFFAKMTEYLVIFSFLRSGKKMTVDLYMATNLRDESSVVVSSNQL